MFIATITGEMIIITMTFLNKIVFLIFIIIVVIMTGFFQPSLTS